MRSVVGLDLIKLVLRRIVYLELLLPVVLVVLAILPEGSFASPSALEIPPLNSVRALPEDNEKRNPLLTDGCDDSQPSTANAAGDGDEVADTPSDSGSEGASPIGGEAGRDGKLNAGEVRGSEPSDRQPETDCDRSDADQGEPDVAEDPIGDLEPTLENRLDLYSDSEHYQRLTASSSLGVTTHGFNLALSKDTVFASDLLGAERSEATLFSIQRDLGEQFGIGAGFGTVASSQWTDLVGSLRMHADFSRATIEASLARDMLAGSAQEIRANIRQTDFSVSASDPLTDRLTSDLEFDHRVYSDGNNSNEFGFSPGYSFALPEGKLVVGYAFSYQGFARNTNNGYWAPQLALSNDGSIAWDFDWIDTYGRVEVSAGRGMVRASSSEAYGQSSSGYDAGAKAVLGFRPTRNMVVEYYWSGTQSARWSSTATGLGLRYIF